MIKINSSKPKKPCPNCATEIKVEDKICELCKKLIQGDKKDLKKRVE